VSQPHCHICGSASLKIASCSEHFRRVTSDCKPWPAGGKLAVCTDCETIQAVITPRWREDAREIYRGYEVYHQSGGAEQAVFDASGNSQTRSERLVTQLSARAPLAVTGNLLDIGCGNGSFLSAFGRKLPGWKLFGAEVDGKDLQTLQAIPGFQHLYTGSLEKLHAKFDFVALIHTLEHIEAPIAFLSSIRSLLKETGSLLVQVPHYAENPFELMTADHASHFDANSLVSTLAKAGFSRENASTSWVSKELSLLVRPDASRAREIERGNLDHILHESLESSLSWLDNLLDRARSTQRNATSFGLFGSSIAATWTATNLPHLPDFFVDEDPARVGRSHMDRPIIDPKHVPRGAAVFVALQPMAADAVLARHGAHVSGIWSH